MEDQFVNRRLTRRALLQTSGTLAAALAAGSLLSACGTDDDEDELGEILDSDDSADSDDDAADEPDVDEDDDDTDSDESADDAESAASDSDDEKRGGTLRQVHSRIPEHIDPNIHSSRFQNRISMQVFDNLIYEYVSGEYEPGLAESWDVSDDLLEYTLHLREDVTFHNGTPFTAQALDASIERMRDPDSGSLRTQMDLLDEGEVVDDYTYALHMEQASAVTINNLSSLAVAPNEVNAAEEMGDEYLRNAVGTGPFMVGEWVSETELILERNPDYNWGPQFMDNQGPAYLDRIHYFFVEEPTTRMVSLESNDADLIDDPPDIEVERLKESDEFDVVEVKTAGLPQSSFMNVTVPPTDDLAVRQAMLHGVDREAAAQALFHGAQSAAYGPLSSASWAYWSGVEDMYPYDPDRAVELLEEAGWVMGDDGVREKDGQRLRLRHVTTSGGALQFAEFMQASLNELGFDYIVEGMAYEATVSRMVENDYEVARLGLSSSDPHGALYGPWHSSQIEEGSQFNRSRVNNPEIDELLDAGIATGDRDERREIYRQLQELIMENAYFMPNWESHQYHVSRTNVKGLKVNITEAPYLQEVWLEDE